MRPGHSTKETGHAWTKQRSLPGPEGARDRHTGSSSDRVHSKALDHDIGAKPKPKQRRFSFRKYFRDATSEKKKIEHQSNMV